jgi:hypothetical protein
MIVVAEKVGSFPRTLGVVVVADSQAFIEFHAICSYALLTPFFIVISTLCAPLEVEFKLIDKEKRLEIKQISVNTHLKSRTS